MSELKTTITHMDDVAVDRFAWRMKLKLAEARAKGRGSWEQCPEDTLMLCDHVACLDSMREYFRAEGIAP